jgi:lipopolysaccharide export system ATP-binding protein
LSELVASDLVKTYKSRRVVDGVSLRVSSSQVVGLLGPNGAGKTTSFYMIVGLISAESGRITLDGRDLTHLPMHARARLGLGYLPQEASVFRKLSVRDNLMTILQAQPGLDPDTRRQRLEQLLDEFQIAHLADSLGISLSGGERRRVEIARALAARPRFILLDEPFAGVDPISIGEIQRIVTQLTESGIGVLITDHNVRETLGICHQAYIIGSGRVIAEGTPERVLNNRRVREVYLGEQFSL